eukprot:g3068.t1
MKDAMKEQDAAKKKATIEYISSEALEESERWVAARFEISDENPSYFKKAKLLSVQALFSVLHSPPLLPIFVERQLKKAETLGRKSDNWSCISPTKTEGARQLFEDLVGTRLLCGMQLFHTGGGGGVGVNLSPTSRALAGLNSVSSGIAAEGFSLASRLIVCNSDHNWELTHSGNTDQIFITQHDKRVPKYSNFGAVVGVARPSTTGCPGQGVVGSGKQQSHNFQSGAGIPVAPALSAANEVARNGVKKNTAARALRTSPAGSGSDNNSLLPEPADSPTNAERVDGAVGTEPLEKPAAAVHQYGSGYGNHQSPLLTASPPPPPSHVLGLPAKAVSAAAAVVAPASGAVGGGGVGAASATAARGSGSGAPAQMSPVSPHVDQITHPYQYVLRRSILRIANTRLQSMSDEEEKSTSADGAASASSTTGAEGSPRFLEQFNRGDASPEIPVWSPECNLRGTSKTSGASTMPKGSLLGRQGASAGGEAKAKQNQKQALGQDEARVLLATSLQNDQSASAFFEPSPTSAGLHNLLPRTKTDASEGSMMSGGNASNLAYDYGHGSGGPTSPTNWLSPTSNLRSLRHESLWSGFRRDSWTRQQRIFCQPDPMPWNIIDQIVSQAHPLPAATPYGTSKLNPENTTPWYRLRSVLKSIVFVLLPVDRAHRVETRQVKEGLALGEFPYLDSAAEGGSGAEEDDFFTCSPDDDEELLLSGAEEGDDQDLLRPRSVSLEGLDRCLGVDDGGGGLAGGRGGHPATGNSSRSSSSTSLAPDPPSSQLHDQSSLSGRLSSRARASRIAQAKRAARIKRQFAAFKTKLEQHVFANYMPSTTSPSQGTPAASKATTLSGGSARTPPGFVPELPIEISASARSAPLLPATDSANTDSGNYIGSSSAATTPAPAATTAPTSGGFCSKTLKVPIRWMEGWDHLSSSKNEWIQLNFDQAYSPEDPFHFSIEWILCSNHAAYRFVLFVLQIAQECGFAMHAVPHSQLFPQPSQRLAKAAVVPKSWNVMSAGEDFTLKRSPFFNRLSLRIPENIEYSRLVEMLVAPPLNLLLVYHMTNSEASGSLSSCAVVGGTKVVEKEAVHFSGASSSKGPVTRSRSLGAAAESTGKEGVVVPYNAGAGSGGGGESAAAANELAGGASASSAAVAAPKNMLASRASPVPSVTNATFGTNEYDTSSGGSTAFWQRSFSPPATLHSANPPARAHVADTTAKVTASVLQPGSTLRFGVDGSSSNAPPRVSRTGDDDGGGSWIFMEPTSGLFFITVTQNHIFWTESKYLGRKPTKRLPEQLAATYEGRMDRKFREFKQVLEKVWQESKQVVMKIQEGGYVGGGWASGFGSGLASSAGGEGGKTSFHLPPEIEMEELR